MITLAAFVIMACSQGAPCVPLKAETYDTLDDCYAGVEALTKMWRQGMDAMLIPAMHCETKKIHT